MVKRLCNVIDFVFEDGNRTHIGVSVYKPFDKHDACPLLIVRMTYMNKMKAQRAQSLRCRKALSTIIRRHEKVFANSGKYFDDFLSELDI